MTREEREKAIDALKISAPFITVTQEEFNDYIQTLNKIMDWIEQEPCNDCISRKEALDICLANDGHGYIWRQIKSLPPATPEPCEDVSDINDGNIYECSCGYGWDKSKVVRHHFCPNCGRAVEPSYNSIKTELKPCDDCISRQAAIDAFKGWETVPVKALELLPSVNPAEKVGHWEWEQEPFTKNWGNWRCSECREIITVCETDWAVINKPNYKYCPNCGAKMEVEE